MSTDLPDSLPADDVLTALADEHRRWLLVHLQQLETPERVSAITRWLATQTDQTGEEEVERIYIHLHHVHLPKLADAGIVDYDAEERTVELTDEGHSVVDSLLQ